MITKLEILEKLEKLKTPEEKEQEKEIENKLRKFYFPLKLVGSGKNEEEAWEDAVDAFTTDPGPMDKFEESDKED